MSELKAISGNEIREDIDYNTRGIAPEDKEWCKYGKELCDTLYYRKSEADKVIEDLEESHKKEIGQLLIEIAGLKEERRWRKCSEELPTKDDANESGKLLGYLSGYGIAHEYHWTDVRDKLYGITHWMPLPSAPKVEK